MAIVRRVILLPVDLLRLTFDFFHLTEWHVARGMAGMLGVTGPSSGPFCDRRLRSIDSAGQPCSICLHAQRYFNPFVFRVLCRWVMAEPVADSNRACVCRRRNSYRATLARYAWVGTVIILFWGAVWISAMSWLAGR